MIENLHDSFKLPKYQTIYNDISEFTVVTQLPWTPARFQKFKYKIESILDLSSEFKGTVKDIVDDFDVRYSGRFFGEIWKPNTEKYGYTGWLS